jgi:hypothetical protein
MKKIKFILVTAVIFLLPSVLFSQIYSQKDIINQYDPFTITISDITLNTNDEDFRENLWVLIVTITAGNEKVVKFFYKDDLVLNTVRNFDSYYALNFTVKRNNTIIMPAFYTLPIKPSLVSIKYEGYSGINESDQALMNQLASSFVYVSSGIYAPMDQVFKFLAGSSEINRPNNSLLTTAEVLQQNLSRRPGIFYMGNPLTTEYVIPNDPKKVIGTNILVQGKKSIEGKISARSNDVWSVTFTKLTDVKLVQNEPYYTKIQGVFNDISSQTVIPSDKMAGYLAKAQEVIDEDLIIGRKTDVYMNDQVVKQFTQLMNLLRAGIRVKSDSLSTTSEMMLSSEREALSYFEMNIKENDINLENQYLFDGYINSSVNRGILLKEIDLIRRYYQIK